jgi:foldase protein PrsA
VTSTVIDARPAALIDGRAVFWGDMRMLLNEAAGGEILEEIMLDLALERAMTDAGIVLSDSDIAAERTLLADTLSPDTEVAMRLVDELRVRNRLGSQRFAGLLRRNAALRALVRDKVEVSDASIRAVYEMNYGTRRQIRIMTFPNLHDAETAIRRVHASESFADVAVEVSTDSSAPRGGLLEPISRADPAYPEALRDVVWKLNIGDVSSPILLDDAYAVIKLERTIAQTGPPIEEVWLEMQRLARLRQERILMDQLARRLLGETTVTILDDSLHESWNKRRAQWR